MVGGGPRSVARQGYTVARWRLWLVWERGAFALYRGTRHNGGGGAPEHKEPHRAAGFFFIVFYKITRLELVAKGKAEHIALAVGVAHGDRTGLRIGRAV